MAKSLRNIDFVTTCDVFPNPGTDPDGYAKAMAGLYTVIWRDADEDTPIGYMPSAVFDVLQKTPESIRGSMEHDPKTRSVRLFHEGATEPERTEKAVRLTTHWRAQKAFAILDGWRDELWPVYGPRGQLLFKMERAAVGLFGMSRYGVHMVAYVRCPEDGDSKWPFRIWVPRRSSTKQSYPGMLDNTIAGGLAADETVEDALVREADEEGSLPESLVRSCARAVGTVSYIFLTDPRSGGESNLVYPECQWVYDLELPADGSVVLVPKDGEVESFKLHTVEEIQEQLRQGLWKPNCALIMLDFFIRHGVYTPAMDDYDEIRRRSHRHLPFPGPHEKHQQPDVSA